MRNQDTGGIPSQVCRLGHRPARELATVALPVSTDHRPDRWRLPSFASLQSRVCRQNNLAHITNARIWQIARKDISFLAYRVATARHFVKSGMSSQLNDATCTAPGHSTKVLSGDFSADANVAEIFSTFYLRHESLYSYTRVFPHILQTWVYLRKTSKSAPTGTCLQYQHPTSGCSCFPSY